MKKAITSPNESINIAHIFGNFSNEEVVTIDLANKGVNVEFSYKITTPKNLYILKDVREDHLPLVQKSAHITNTLFSKGFIYTPRNIACVNGGYIYTDSKGFNWELQTFINGEHVNTRDLTFEHVENIALGMSKLHKTYLNDVIPDFLDVAQEITYLEMFNQEQHEKTLEAVNKLLAQELPAQDVTLFKTYWDTYLIVRDEILSKLEHLDEASLQKSLIHRDLHKGNIMFKTNSTELAGFVDWDVIAKGNILQDICYVSSHYLITKPNKMIDFTASKELIQTLLNAYQKEIRLNQDEKEAFVVLTNILLVRATRWWVKRYLELFLVQIDEKSIEKFEKHRIGCANTLNNWLNDRNTILNIFTEINL